MKVVVRASLPDVPAQRRRNAHIVGLELLVVDREAFALEPAREWVRSGLAALASPLTLLRCQRPKLGWNHRK